MKCQKCNKNEANVQYREFINGVSREIHLCDQCASEVGLMNHTSELFRSFESDMMRAFAFPFGGRSLLGRAFSTPFAGFPEIGGFFDNDRIEEIETAAPSNEPINNEEKPEARKPDAVDELKAKLLDAIADERYEDAAQLRDKIKEIKGE